MASAKTGTKTGRKPIRYGVFGMGRGRSFMGPAADGVGFQLVAVCDARVSRKDGKPAVKEFAKQRGATGYTDFDRFLDHDMDAVVLANYFHEHAPYAIKALEAGKHVMSECAACHTMGEGVALVRAVEKAKKTYMFAENYAYSPARQEMRRVFREDGMGTFMYGEGEYVHSMSADSGNAISPGVKHWRNWIPATYYCTHALSPIMFITDTWPEKVNGFVIRKAPDNPVSQRRPSISDAASMIALRMDNGAVVKLLQVGLRGHSRPTRISCARGEMSGDGGDVSIVREQYHEKPAYPKSMSYRPNLPRLEKEMEVAARASGHGGGDFWMMCNFARSIRSGRRPFLDVYRGVAMSVVGIQAWRSVLNNSNTEIIPDFRLKSVRKKYENDHWSPDPERAGPGQPPASIDGFRKPEPGALKYARKIWASS